MGINIVEEEVFFLQTTPLGYQNYQNMNGYSKGIPTSVFLSESQVSFLKNKGNQMSAGATMYLVKNTGRRYVAISKTQDNKIIIDVKDPFINFQGT